MSPDSWSRDGDSRSAPESRAVEARHLLASAQRAMNPTVTSVETKKGVNALNRLRVMLAVYDQVADDALSLLDQHLSPEVRLETQRRVIQALSALTTGDSGALPDSPVAPPEEEK